LATDNDDDPKQDLNTLRRKNDHYLLSVYIIEKLGLCMVYCGVVYCFVLLIVEMKSMELTTSTPDPNRMFSLAQNCTLIHTDILILTMPNIETLCRGSAIEQSLAVKLTMRPHLELIQNTTGLS
jgi:hypothetical protein